MSTFGIYLDVFSSFCFAEGFNIFFLWPLHFSGLEVTDCIPIAVVICNYLNFV